MNDRTEVPSAGTDVHSSIAQLLLTVEQAAERLGIGRTMMYARIREGAVESVPVGRLRRVPPDALKSYVARLRAGQAGAA